MVVVVGSAEVVYLLFGEYLVVFERKEGGLVLEEDGVRGSGGG